MNNMKETDLAMIINNDTYTDYLMRLRLIATSLFTWENLDDYAGYGASRFLEQSLYDFGRACFYQDKELGYMALRVNPSDKLNIYELPVRVTAWSIGYTKNLKFDDVVYVMNNELQLPTSNTLRLMAYRLYETERTIDVNLMAQKTPILIEGDTKTILTLKQIYMQYSGNTPFIFGNKQYDIANRLNVLKTDAPYLIDKLELHKHEIWNEAMTYLGIDNAKVNNIMEKTKPIRGGARDGAGRKRMGGELRKCLTVRISPSALDKLESLAKSQGVSKGVYVENLINKI